MMNKVFCLALCLVLGSSFAQSGSFPVSATVLGPASAARQILAPSVRQGETFKLEVKATQSGYLTLLLRRPDGKLGLLQRSQRTVAGTTLPVSLPTTRMNPGQYQVLAVFSGEPLTFAQAYRAGEKHLLLEITVRPAIQAPAILDLRSPLQAPLKEAPRGAQDRPGGGDWPLQRY